MPISSKKYVDIASAVINGAALAEMKLDGRVFTPSTEIAANEILEFPDAAEVADLFGNDSPEHKFAVAYFALLTPAPVSKAQALQFARHCQETADAELVGDTPEDLTAIQQYTAEKFAIEVGGVLYTSADLDFQSEQSLEGVIQLINNDAEISTSGAVLGYDSGTGLVSVTAAGAVDFEVQAGDLAESLGLLDGTYTAATNPETMLDAWQRAEDFNPSYGSAFFLKRGDKDECATLAAANAALNVMHQLFIQVKKGEAQDFYDAMGETASVGLILEDTEKYVAHIPMALMSATNYARRNATMNYMFRVPGITVQPQVVDTQTATQLDNIRVNYFGQTASAGNKINFFQRGQLCGGNTAIKSMSMHTNEQWLKARFEKLWFEMLLSMPEVPANLDGKAYGVSILTDVIEQAVRNGVISKGRELGVGDRNVITAATGDDAAWIDVVSNGCWFDVQIVDRALPSGEVQYTLDYILVYAAKTQVSRVTGSHNIVA